MYIYIHCLLGCINPDLKMPLCSTCHKNRGYEGIPNNVVNWSIMCSVSVEKL